MDNIISNFNLDLCQENLIPFLSSQQVLTQIVREMILDRAICQIDVPEDATRNDKLQQFKEQQWGNQLERYFLQRKRHLDQVVYSMIRTSELGLTQELYFRAKEQEASFADLAKTYSQGSEALTNGIVGPVAIASLPPQIAQKLAGLQPGKISSPIKFQNQWVIFKLEHWLPAQLNNKTKQLLLNELFEAWLQEQIAQQLPKFEPSQSSSNLRIAA